MDRRLTEIPLLRCFSILVLRMAATRDALCLDTIEKTQDVVATQSSTTTLYHTQQGSSSHKSITQQAESISIMANEAPPAIQYRDLMAECQQLMTKVADLESDRNEHILVEDTLKPLDGGRRAYRLVGDVLVERTVAEVCRQSLKTRTMCVLL